MERILMKLYYSPGACSMAVHIMLKELKINTEYEAVDLKTHKTREGEDFNRINPKGYVPALVLDGNRGLLTEATAVLLYVSELKPVGDFNRYRLVESLSHLATEVHKNFGPLFSPTVPSEIAKLFKEKLSKQFALLDKQLGEHEYLLDGVFGAPDAYLFTMLHWCPKLGMDLALYKNLTAFVKRVEARPSVVAAMKEEGLTK